MTLLLHPKIEVRDSGIEGKGLFAKAPFIKGERFKAASGEHSWVTMTDAEFQEYIKTVDSYDAVYLGNGGHRGYSLGTWWINQSTPCEPTSRRFFRHRAVRTGHLILK